jgi:acetyl esterase
MATSIGSRKEPFLEPLTQQFVDDHAALAGPSLETFSPANTRARLTSVQAIAVGKPAAHVEDVTVAGKSGGALPLRIIRPRNGSEALPVVMYFHGGGWIMGDTDTHDRLAREIAVAANAALFFVDYDRSPEAQYPTAIEQAYAATLYVAEHSAEFGVDSTRLAVVGDGAGGNIATTVCLMAKERKSPEIVFQVLLYPITDSNFDTPSYAAFADGPWLTRETMQRFWDAYLPDKAARHAITASPLAATIDQLSGLPDGLVIVAENDVLRDEGEAYARKLGEAGVRVTSVRYNGAIHDFMMLNAIADAPTARSAISQVAAALRDALA